MKRLAIASLAAILSAACTANAGKTAPNTAASSPTAIAPTTKIGEMDGAPITYADLEKDIGTKVRQAEVEYLTKVYDLRKGALDELITKRLFEGEAKKVNKSLDQWFQEDFMAKVPGPSEAEIKAFYEEHKAQMPPGQSFDELKGQISAFVKRQNGQKHMTEMLDALKKVHGVKLSLAAPELPRIDVAATGPVRGNKDAKVTIIAFSDFQCPFCSRVVPTLEKVMKDYDGKVKLVFRNFPLDFHPMAEKAAEAGACANEQGKFWDMHDKMFGDQSKLAVEDLKKTAHAIAGIDAAKFDACLDGGGKKELIDADQKAGSEAGVTGTPAFFINGIFINGAQPYEQFKDAIDRELNKG
ncbi:MAG: DsbA family protein [Deltaproteobacteria bacterium]|nr:DsbA family protein [Deltaproteobacteria bacterium]